MIKTYLTTYIADSDIFDHFNTCYQDYTIFNECANDTYISLGTDDASLEDIYDELSYTDDENYTKQLKHEIELIEYLRNMGYKDGVLVFVSW